MLLRVSVFFFVLRIPSYNRQKVFNQQLKDKKSSSNKHEDHWKTTLLSDRTRTKQENPWSQIRDSSLVDSSTKYESMSTNYGSSSTEYESSSKEYEKGSTEYEPLNSLNRPSWAIQQQEESSSTISPWKKYQENR